MLRSSTAIKPEPLDRARIKFERSYLLELLAASRGNVSAAARLANIDRTTLYRMAERTGVQFDRERRAAA